MHFNRCYQMASSIGPHMMAGLALTGLVTIRCRMSDEQESVAAYSQALHHWQGVGDQVGLWITLRNLVPVLARHGRHEAALAIYEAVMTSQVALHEGPELDALRRAAALAEERLGGQASVIRLRWQGAPIGSAVDVATTSIEELLGRAGAVVVAVPSDLVAK